MGQWTHALFGGFGYKGSVNHSGTLSPDAVISSTTSDTTLPLFSFLKAN